MNIGVIFVGFGTRDLLDKSLAPWIELRARYMQQFDRRSSVHICAVSLRFAGFQGQDDGTTEALRGYYERGDIDYLITEPQDVPETQARGMALSFLRRQGVNLTIQWDSDEVTDIESIQRMLDYVDNNPFTQWFRFSYRNLVFTEKTWLSEPFTPPRVHRMTAANGYYAHSFSADNDICYGHHILRNLLSQESFASQVIPPQVFSPLHYSWLSDNPERAARSRVKIKYQLEARGWPVCSFAWDDTKGLIFNPALPAPKVITEDA